MDYSKFIEILNKHIFEGEKKDLLRKIAENPERFIGLFRPTKPHVKILQHLLQSHEIRMGSALEKIIEKALENFGFTNLPKNILNENGENLSLDQYFYKDGKYYFVEQKVRDDHDSSKKRGQISNFETKLEILYKKHGSDLTGIMYFIDPDLNKNMNFYISEIEKLKNFYGIDILLLYGSEFFEFLKQGNFWNNMLEWLKKWKNNLPELPELNFDASPEENFKEIKDLALIYWRKILENDKLWDEGIIKVLSKEGKTLQLLLNYFKTNPSNPYQQIAQKLSERLNVF
ncbi:MAG: hypothetical protein QXP36_10245 [Conexivisphaerales archaeon]